MARDQRGIGFDPALGSFTGVPATLFEALDISASRFPDKPAVVLEHGESYTFAQLKARSLQLAGRFSHLSVSPGSKVGLLLDNSVEFCLALYALSRLGAVAVMLPGKLKSAALMELVAHSRPDMVIVEPDRRSLLRDCGCPTITIPEIQEMVMEPAHAQLPDVDVHGNDLALMMFTSGTSSRPKTVAISNDNIIQAAMTYERVFALGHTDRLIFGVPLYHVTGVVAIIAQFTLTGCTLYLQRRFHPERFLLWAREVRATYVHASPTVFELLLRSWPTGCEIPSIRILACGAAVMPTSRILRLKEKLPHAEFRTIYGLTETTSPASIFPVDAGGSELIGASGWPIPGVELRIVDDRRCEVNSGEVGEIEVRGSTVCLGYITGDGRLDTVDWLPTGDLGFLDEHCFLHVVDRKKDQINRGGEKIYPHVVEEALSNIAGITDACVVGIDDELYGEVAGALYVADRTIAPSQLTAELRTSLPSFAIPSIMRQVDEIPRTAGLKADRRAARDLLIQEL